MIDQAYEIVLQACGGSLSIDQIGWLFVVIKNLISVCAWLLKHFEGVLKDD